MNDFESDPNTIIFPEGRRFNCLLCGRCCKTWRITVSRTAAKRLRNTFFYKNLKKIYPQIPLISFNNNKQEGFISKINDQCIFSENNLCGIHKYLSSALKPSACRNFPFLLFKTPVGVFTGLSYHCPAIQSNYGAPVEQMKDELHAFLNKDGETIASFYSSADIDDNLSVSWEGYMLLEKFLIESFEEDIYTGITKFLDILIRICHTGAKIGAEYIQPSEIIQIIEEISCRDNLDETVLFKMQYQYILSIIAILEMFHRAVLPGSIDIIRYGGILHSDTFEKTLTIKPLHEYMKIDSSHSAEEEIKEYLKHLVWRKFLLRDNSILLNATALSLIPPVFAWYSHVSTAAENRTVAALEDTRRALGIVDLYFQHLDILQTVFVSLKNNLLDL